MNHVDLMRRSYSNHSEIQFRKLTEEVVVLDVENAHATASISLYGGQVLTWRPKCQVEPVLWLSEAAHFTSGKAIRGGVPICWPWFGANSINSKLPAHGYARISPWVLQSIRSLDSGATEITLTMVATDLSRQHDGCNLQLSICITVGDTLGLALTTNNDGNQSVVLSEGLHTYFKVGDIGSIQVLGLEESECVDLLRANLRCTENGPIRFNEEFGRIYVNNTATCVIEDTLLGRRIHVQKTGSSTTAVWNPWAVTAGKMDDLGPEAWRNMVCVESANALENQVTILSGGTHTLTAIYSAENLT